MRALRFALGLVVAVLIHALGVRMVPWFSQVVDLFLVVVLFNAVNSSLQSGLFGGLAGGLAADALTGSLYGLYGTADTIAGYGTALASQRLVVQRPVSVMFLFAVAAAVQQGVVLGLRLLLLGDAAPPEPSWLVARAVTVGALGWAGYVGRGRWEAIAERWRQSRRSRLR